MRLALKVFLAQALVILGLTGRPPEELLALIERHLAAAGGVSS